MFRKIFIQFLLGLTICSCMDSSGERKAISSPYSENDNVLVEKEDTHFKKGNEKEPIQEKEVHDTDIVVNTEDSMCVERVPEIEKSDRKSQEPPVKSKRFYQEMIEDFCKKNYNRKFPGRSYIYGSLRVDNLSKEDEKTVMVRGSFSFKGWGNIISYNNREFKAYVRDDGDCNYHILFCRRREIFGREWMDTGNIPFTYNPDE